MSWNQYIKLLILTVLFHLFMGIKADASAQVIPVSELKANQSGSLISSINNKNQPLEYEWVFNSKKGLISNYELVILLDKKELRIPVKIRNLRISLYIELIFSTVNKDAGANQTLTAHFNKTNKWLNVKMAKNKECESKDVNWSKTEKIQDIGQLLNEILIQVDRNLILSCYGF